MRGVFFLNGLIGYGLGLAVAGAHAGGIDDWLREYHDVSETGRTSHIVDIDNDTLLLNRNDGFYSSGMRYTNLVAKREQGSVTIFGWRVGQELYTASDIKLAPAQIPARDHPYAAWLYAGFFRDVHRADGTRTSVGIDIGCLGPCAGGEWTQTKFHQVIDQPLPKGWSTQVRNELGLMLYGDISPVRWTPRTWLDVTPGFHARFGNIFTDAAASMRVRAGQLNIFPGDPTFHAFFRAELRAVAYNATLQGGYFSRNNPRTVEPKRWGGEADAGVEWRRGQVGIIAALVRRSNEIRDLANAAGTQNFLRLQFSYTP